MKVETNKAPSPNRIGFFNQVSMSFGAKREEKFDYHYSYIMHHINAIMSNANSHIYKIYF